MSQNPAVPSKLLGRRSEREALDRLVADAVAGRSRVIVLRGEAGVGKSALLGYLSGRVAGWHVARAVGVESEMELAYAGLHLLCAPMLDHLDRLPAPQRDALATVFGLSPGAAPNRFLVGLATLTLFADVAERQPLACIVDDAQWLDRASAQILGFVGRRLLAERIAVVCAARTGAGDHVLAGLPELSIPGLGDSDARALLLANVPGPLDARVCDQIIMESHGNPLALLELPRAWNVADLAGGFGLPGGHPVAGRIEQSYVRRLQQLPSDTRLLVLTAAAEPLGDLVLLHQAAGALGVDIAAAGPAQDGALLELDGRVEFAHPLVRSAAYRSAAADDRHRVHRALADATVAETDPDRRAWHRARATPGPDEEVAAELEGSADRAQARGGVAAAAAFMQRSAELTIEPARRAERALAAAEASYLAGSRDDALRLAGIAERGPLSEFHRVRADVLRGRVAMVQRRTSDAPPLLLRAARRLERFDRRVARDTYRDALIAAIYTGRFAGDTGLPEVAAAIRSAPPSADPPSVTDELLDAAALLVDAGYAAGAPAVQRALAAFRAMSMSRGLDLHWVFLAGRVSTWVWDHETWDVLSGWMLKLVRDAGVLALLPFADAARVGWELFAGNLAAVSAYVEEQDRVQEAIGGDSSPGSRIVLAAYRGHEAEVAQLDEATTRDAVARGDGPWVAMLNWATAVLGNGLSRYDEALSAGQRGAAYRPDMHMSNWALCELVEAAARCGRPEAATGALGRLAEMARACGTDWVIGVEARARALVADPADADELHREAIERLGRTRFRTELARAHLLYGEWLRREGRRVDARQQLRAAHEMLTAIGMEAFAERARRELLATGEKARKRSAGSRMELTSQEEQIARLACDGLSNPEIGAQLFVSARTVEWHLRNVFTKLDITSRRQLRTALPGDSRRAGTRA
jgi:DNA-binding CsgD family transcriptional regulator